MKILFFGWDPSITPASRTVDYMGDCVYHGLKSLLGKDVHTVYDQFHMYTDLGKGISQQFHGKGFTLCGNLEPVLRNVIEEADLKENLKNKVYDCVIFSRMYRSTRHYEEVCQHYNDNEIVIIDGHDLDEIPEQYRKHMYFKRELVEEPNAMLHPISFSIPEEKLVPADLTAKKEKELGDIIPGKLETYTFNSEKEYYNDYKKSLYGITHKKGGWDCMRHLEIMANKCVPFFPGIDDCPLHTMTDYDKETISQVYHHVQNNTMTQEIYGTYCQSLYEHVAQHQTTVAQAQRIINIIENGFS